MATTIDVHQRLVFERQLFLQAMQTESRLSGSVTTQRLEGKQKFFDSYGDISLVERDTRLESTVLSDTPRYRRAIRPRHFKFSQAFDHDIDDVRLDDLVEPNATFLTSWRSGTAKKKDDLIIEAFDGTAYGDELGTVPYDFANYGGGTIDIGTTGLTLEKVLAAKMDLMGNDVDVDAELHCVATPHQYEWMYLDARLTGSDFVGEARALLTGQITNFLGINFHMSNRISEHQQNEIYAYMYTKDAIILGVREDAQLSQSVRGDLNDAEQLTMKVTMAATRHFDNQVVRINCDNDATPARQS